MWPGIRRVAGEVARRPQVIDIVRTTCVIGPDGKVRIALG